MIKLDYKRRRPIQRGRKMEYGNFYLSGKYTLIARFPKWITSIIGLRPGQTFRVLGYEIREGKTVIEIEILDGAIK